MYVCLISNKNVIVNERLNHKAQNFKKMQISQNFKNIIWWYVAAGIGIGKESTWRKNSRGDATVEACTCLDNLIRFY